jgi:hypothetical protein
MFVSLDVMGVLEGKKFLSKGQKFRKELSQNVRGERSPPTTLSLSLGLSCMELSLISFDVKVLCLTKTPSQCGHGVDRTPRSKMAGEAADGCLVDD